MTNLLNIIFGDFGIWLVGYRIKFSCLYIPQGHYFINTLWLWSTVEMSVFGFEKKSTFNNKKKRILHPCNNISKSYTCSMFFPYMYCCCFSVTRKFLFSSLNKTTKIQNWTHSFPDIEINCISHAKWVFSLTKWNYYRYVYGSYSLGSWFVFV